MPIEQIMEQAKKENRVLLTDIESKEILREAGVPVIETKFAKTKKEAVSLSKEIGFPVAMKVVSPDIIHKSDIGGVKLWLKNCTLVSKAYNEIMDSVGQRAPKARIKGVVLQRMVESGREVIIGMSRDEQFGPVIMFGLGGIFVEVLKDVSIRIAPVTIKDASKMIKEIKGYPLLSGYRGQEPVNIASLEQLVVKVSELAEKYPQIRELDLNPVIIYRKNAVALDAKILLEPNQKDMINDNVMSGKCDKLEDKVAKKITPELDELFTPRGVAVVGVSPAEKHFSYANDVVLYLKRAGFPAIYPVNPKYTEAFGLPCYNDLASIPAPVDHVVVNIPAESALKLLDDCAAKGVKSIQMFTAGFSETGDAKRAELEKSMLEKARKGSFRIIGPNCTGLFVPKSRLITRPTVPLEPGPIAFLSQSGGYADDVPLFGGTRGLRFSKLISYGNAIDVNESELMEYFARDPETEIIGAYIEGVRDGRRFFNALKEATKFKPVVIQKGGMTNAGKRAAQGHTASLTSSVTVFNALCRQTNVIQVDNVEELVDTLVALRFTTPYPQGNGVAVVGTGGGTSVLAADEMEKAGLCLPPFSSEMQAKLRQLLPSAGNILTNPIDSWNLTSPKSIYDTLCLLGSLPEIHAFVFHTGFHPVSRWSDGKLSAPGYLASTSEAFKQAQSATGKPVLLALSQALNIAEMKDFLATRDAFVKAGLPVFYSLRGVAKAVARIIKWRQA